MHQPVQETELTGGYLELSDRIVAIEADLQRRDAEIAHESRAGGDLAAYKLKTFQRKHVQTQHRTLERVLDEVGLLQLHRDRVRGSVPIGRRVLQRMHSGIDSWFQKKLR